MASVRDCKALAEAQPVEVTSASMPWFISSQAGGDTERGGGQVRNTTRDNVREEGSTEPLDPSARQTKAAKSLDGARR